MTTKVGHKEHKEWPLKQWCLRVFWANAAATVALFTAAPVLAMALGQYGQDAWLLWVLVPLVCVFYAGIFAICKGMASMARWAPPSVFVPKRVREDVGRVLDRVHAVVPNVALVIASGLLVITGVLLIVGIVAEYLAA